MNVQLVFCDELNKISQFGEDKINIMFFFNDFIFQKQATLYIRLTTKYLIIKD